MANVSLQIIREYLIADTSDALYTDVGERIDTLGMFDGDKQRVNDQAHIVMNRRGGADTDRLPTANPFVMFQVFAGRGRISEDSSGAFRCMEIYENLKTRLHNVNGKTTTSGFIISSFEQQPPQDLIDPDTQWPFVLAFYDIHTRDLS
jgi:hypothetical protein